MAGYNGYSMSNNAVSAYDNGEKPLSKWRKSDILEEIEIEIANVFFECIDNIDDSFIVDGFGLGNA